MAAVTSKIGCNARPLDETLVEGTEVGKVSQDVIGWLFVIIHGDFGKRLVCVEHVEDVEINPCYTAITGEVATVH